MRRRSALAFPLLVAIVGPADPIAFGRCFTGGYRRRGQLVVFGFSHIDLRGSRRNAGATHATLAAGQMELFAPEGPPGFRYQAGFIDAGEQAALVSALAAVRFAGFEMRGVVARRRVAFFGQTYGHQAAPPLPDFLQPLRAAIASWAGLEPAAFAMALINEYRPGAPIGWHRDAPQYDVVAGVSVLSACRMMFRPYVRPGQKQPGSPRRRATHAVLLEPGSVYLLTEAARTGYEHHIPAVARLRYSITFRTLREPARRASLRA